MENNEALINKKRKINARATALRSAGKSDDEIADAILMFDDLSPSMRSKIKNAKVLGQSKSAVDNLIEFTKVTEPTTTAKDLEIDGALGSVSRFLGMEKFGRRVGAELAKLDPEHRRNLENLSEEERQVISTSGVSGKEAAGSAAMTALNLAGGAILKGGAKAALGVAGKAGLFKPVANIGARTLNPAQMAQRPIATIAKGAGIGYAGDVASGLNDNENMVDVFTPGLGTLTGGTIGAIPGVRNLVRGNGYFGNKGEKAFEKVVDTVAPKISGKEGARTLGSGSVSVKEPGLFSRAAADFSQDPETVRIAQTVQDIVKPSKSASYNLNAVKDEIKNVAESSVKPFLSANKVPFNFADLRTRLELVEPAGGLKADPAAFANYSRVREEVLGDVANFLRKSGKTENSTDLNELWNARKVIDQRIEAELGATTFDSPQYAGVKAAATDLRSGINKFIADSLANPGQAEELNKFYEFMNVASSRGMRIASEADAVKLLRQQMGISDVPEDVAKAAFFRFQLDRMSNMYEAVTNLAPKVRSELGKNKLDMIFSSPTARTLTTAGAVGGGVYAGTRVLSGGGNDE